MIPSKPSRYKAFRCCPCSRTGEEEGRREGMKRREEKKSGFNVLPLSSASLLSSFPFFPNRFGMAGSRSGGDRRKVEKRKKERGESLRLCRHARYGFPRWCAFRSFLAHVFASSSRGK
jgi:hypothetical protein